MRREAKKKVTDTKVITKKGPLTTRVASKEMSVWYYELQNAVFPSVLNFPIYEVKSNETNLGPDFWNLRQHRRAHFVELDLLPIARRDKAGTGEDSCFGDIY